MSVTAFPVLARILTDRGIQQTRMGVIALTCAAVDDVTAWCLLAFVVSVASTRGGRRAAHRWRSASRYIARDAARSCGRCCARLVALAGAPRRAEPAA